MQSPTPQWNVVFLISEGGENIFNCPCFAMQQTVPLELLSAAALLHFFNVVVNTV